MKFTDGFWHLRPGVQVLRPRQVEGHLDPRPGRPTGDRPGLGARASRRRPHSAAGRPGAAIPFGAVQDRPDYPWPDGVELRWYAPAPGAAARVRIPSPDADAAVVELTHEDGEARLAVLAGRAPGARCTVVPAR
jgi:hypothetical protein